MIPRAFASAAALTRLTRSVVDVSSSPRRTAATSGDASTADELAGDLERQRPDAGPAELGEEPAERLRERQVRRERLGRLGRQQRGVDRVARAPAGEHVEDLVGDLLGDARPGPPRSTRRGAGSGACSARRAAASRSAARSRRRRRRRRRGGRSRSAAATRRLVDDAAAGDVQEDRAGLHPGELGRVPISPRVARVSGTWTEMTSARARSVVERRRARRRGARPARRSRTGRRRGRSSPSPAPGPRSPGRSCRARRSRASGRAARGP